ncbi:MAG: glycoside hydrolase [Gammaproteobacteria bacterium]|nr:MAG: glycoside hydrolase [Gammaproteobacteria bacterium]
MSADRLRVVLCWHLHQPEYRDPSDGEFLAPWTYLHVVKDYVDMAAHLESAPQGVRAVVNFTPILLEQIVDCAERVRAALDDGTDIGDSLLSSLLAPELPQDHDRRRALLELSLHAQEQQMIERFPAYARLVAMTRAALEIESGPDYLGDAHLADALTWYHLAWLGETVRRSDQRVQALLKKEHGYTAEDRRELVEVIAELLAGVIPRYDELAASGRVELSTSPYAHAMMPLLIDFNTAREARPDTALPTAEIYPGGSERAAWHLEQAVAYCNGHFAARPPGCWPSEGGVSARSLELIGQHGFAWTASGQAVLRHSLAADDLGSEELHRPYRLDQTDTVCFFRDDELSDLIGFSYKDWHGDDAVADFIHRLQRIAAEGEPGRVVAIILDGENPWEHYPDNGIHFIPALYRALLDHEALELTTFSDCVNDSAVPVRPLSQLVAGSWVYGDFGTWIGDADKNRAWDLLCEAKCVYDRKIAEIDDASRRSAIERQLGICEGSDWFWWFGDYNPADTVAEFDALYRRQLAALYALLDEPEPKSLAEAVSHGHGRPELGGTMRRGSE